MVLSVNVQGQICTDKDPKIPKTIPPLRVHQICHKQKFGITVVRKGDSIQHTKNRYTIVMSLTGGFPHIGNFSAMIPGPMRFAGFFTMRFIPCDRPLQAFTKLHLCLKPKLLPRPAHIQAPLGLAVRF